MPNQHLIKITDSHAEIISLADSTLINAQRFDLGAMQVDDIYVAKVIRTHPVTNIIFVDIGTAQPATLRTLPSSKHPDGQRLIVQVLKPEKAANTLTEEPAKGALVTTSVSLEHPLAAYRLSTTALRYSKKLTTEQMSQIEPYLADIQSQLSGVTIRTQAKEAPQLLKCVLTVLLKQAQQLQATQNLHIGNTPNKVGFLFRQYNAIEKVLLDQQQFHPTNSSQVNVYCNDAQWTKAIAESEVLNTTERTLQCNHTPDLDRLYQTNQVAQQLRLLLSPKLTLPSGAFLLIEPTAALCAVDINTGSATKVDLGVLHSLPSPLPADLSFHAKINLEAIHFFCSQLIQRQLSGIMVLDLLKHINQPEKNILENYGRHLLTLDSAITSVSKISHLGLLEISRQFQGASLAEQFEK